ncbi:MAG: DUF2993 domain-containing protein [Oscillospiraceae bacterium]|nr:DUF2993 domain-containing protein [Oscillospiraceae bacterium]
MKKILAIVLSLVLALSLAIPTLAAPATLTAGVVADSYGEGTAIEVSEVLPLLEGVKETLEAKQFTVSLDGSSLIASLLEQNGIELDSGLPAIPLTLTVDSNRAAAQLALPLRDALNALLSGLLPIPVLPGLASWFISGVFGLFLGSNIRIAVSAESAFVALVDKGYVLDLYELIDGIDALADFELDLDAILGAFDEILTEIPDLDELPEGVTITGAQVVAGGKTYKVAQIGIEDNEIRFFFLDGAFARVELITEDGCTALDFTAFSDTVNAALFSREGLRTPLLITWIANLATRIINLLA